MLNSIFGLAIVFNLFLFAWALFTEPSAHEEEGDGGFGGLRSEIVP